MLYVLCTELNWAALSELFEMARDEPPNSIYVSSDILLPPRHVRKLRLNSARDLVIRFMRKQVAVHMPNKTVRIYAHECRRPSWDRPDWMIWIRDSEDIVGDKMAGAMMVFDDNRGRWGILNGHGISMRRDPGDREEKPPA